MDPRSSPASAKPFLRRLAGDRHGPPPVWLMRQAGRYLPEYREVRAAIPDFLTLCYTPELAAEVTLQPIRRFGFDAAILFADILVIPDALGVEVRFVEGEGPRLAPLRTMEAVERLDLARVRPHLAPVLETIRRVAATLPDETALIGFAGAPWTLAAYAVEGGGSRDFPIARALARQQPQVFAMLIERLTAATIDYLCAQIEAGAEAVQLFDSWAGVLAPEQRDLWCVAPTRRIVTALKAAHPQVPVILFPRGVGPAYADFATLGADALSLDTGIGMTWAARHLPPGPALQGNLDPTALLGPVEALRAEADRVVDAARGRAHIFNLGHGVLPETSPEHVKALVDHLKSRAD